MRVALGTLLIVVSCGSPQQLNILTNQRSVMWSYFTRGEVGITMSHANHMMHFKCHTQSQPLWDKLLVKICTQLFSADSIQYALLSLVLTSSCIDFVSVLYWLLSLVLSADSIQYALLSLVLAFCQSSFLPLFMHWHSDSSFDDKIEKMVMCLCMYAYGGAGSRTAAVMCWLIHRFQQCPVPFRISHWVSARVCASDWLSCSGWL